jgi:hypothetical protein
MAKMQLEGAIMNLYTTKSQVMELSERAEVQPETQDDEFRTLLEESLSNGQEEWLLKFDLNERGVGRILLPPSLSVFLQSDRICVMPMGGGLFVKSV